MGRVCLLISCMLQVLFLIGCQMDVVGDKSKEPSARGWPSWVPPIVQTLQPIVINVGPKPTPQPTPAHHRRWWSAHLQIRSDLQWKPSLPSSADGGDRSLVGARYENRTDRNISSRFKSLFHASG